MTAPNHDDHDQMPPPTLEEVSPGIHAYIQLDGSWGLNNSAFVVGRDAVTVIDTCFTEVRARNFREAIRTVTHLPLRTLVNTHSHGDHTHGNYLFPGATIVGHELTRQAMLEAGLPPEGGSGGGLFPNVKWGELEMAPPFVTFDDRVNLYVEDLKIEATFVGPAHTSNDVIYWVPDRKLLFAGDLIFNGGTPFVIAGSVQGSLNALESIRALGAETIVPGHGEICGPEIIDEMVSYLRFLQESARKGFDAGLAPLELARQIDLGRYTEWHDTERLAGNIHRAYSEIRGEPLGVALDARSMIADMIEFNGGQPVRCVA